MQNYYTGTSGLLLPVPNKEFFPPEFKDKSRLNFYASLFNSLEVNSSFYKVPMSSTVGKWAADVPDDFKFTFKLSREITHNKGLAFDPEAVDNFMRIISAVAEKSGSLLVQFPPGVKLQQLKQVELLLSTLKQADSSQQWDIAIEFRDKCWYQEDFYALVHQYGMGMVVHDKLSVASSIVETDLDFVYVRFHGPNGDYKGRYEDDFLYEYGSYIQQWLAEGKRVYSYFNNTMGDAISNLFTLRDSLLSDH